MERKQSTLLSLCYEYSGDDINIEEKDWHEAKHLVKIFDNYAIEFNKWTHNLRDCKDNSIEYNQWLNISDEELLRMFKKEKGL